MSWEKDAAEAAVVAVEAGRVMYERRKAEKARARQESRMNLDEIRKRNEERKAHRHAAFDDETLHVDGEKLFRCFNGDEVDLDTPFPYEWKDARYIAAVVNSRPEDDIDALIAEVERLRCDKCRHDGEIGWGPIPHAEGCPKRKSGMDAHRQNVVDAGGNE